MEQTRVKKSIRILVIIAAFLILAVSFAAGALYGFNNRPAIEKVLNVLGQKPPKQFQEDIKGSFDGIGAEIGIRKGVLTIISPLKDSPAERVGLKAGDKIFKVDDTVTADLMLDEAVRLIRGPRGTEVKLLVLRDSFDQPKEFKIIRDEIRVSILTTEKKENGIFVIKLNHFTENDLIL